jgi:hypothetical protein
MLGHDELHNVFKYLSKKERTLASTTCKQFYSTHLDVSKRDSTDYFYFDGSYQSILTMVNREPFIKRINYYNIDDECFYIYPENVETIHYTNCKNIDLNRVENKDGIKSIRLIESELNEPLENMESIFKLFPNLESFQDYCNSCEISCKRRKCKKRNQNV